ncbi:MAG: hypothetical protein MJY44_02595 [Bacteroidales bacterium]|nr:hypothetical protein [Bacteroidales bacterium]
MMRAAKFILSAVMLSLCVLPAAGQKHDRGITSLKAKGEPFVRKGNWTIGGTAAISTYAVNNYGFTIINGINATGYRLSAKPDFMYALSDDLAIGLSVDYTRVNFGLASAGLSVMGTSIDVNDYNVIKHDIGGVIFCRKYLTLGTSGRFALYIDAGLKLAGGEGKISDRQLNGIVGTYEKNFKIALNVNPGVAMYVTDHLVMGIGVGILGIECSWAEQVHNQIATGSRDGFGAAYMLNILAISFGAYYSF